MTQRVVVVGAGIVGLSVAWSCQSAGMEVTVVERGHVAAGASWGNAGWLSPGMVAPLPDPAVLRAGARALVDRRSALYAPPSSNPAHWLFLARLAAHCTHRSWRHAAIGLQAITSQALAAYDELATGGVDAPTVEAPILAAFTDESRAGAALRELHALVELGRDIPSVLLDGDAARALAPHLSDRVRAAVRMDAQRFIDPGAFAEALAGSVTARGGTVLEHVAVTGVRQGGRVDAGPGPPLSADVVVLCAGAWVSAFARPLGVRTAVGAGRGYSFTVDAAPAVPGPLYLPEARVACTPYRGGLRVTGGMELRPADRPLDARRIDAIAAAAQPLLTGIDWTRRRDEWVGPRPITPDGLPLIGPTADPQVYVAGGHGMWGVTLGPVTGKLLAEAITTGRTPPALAPFDPRR